MVKFVADGGYAGLSDEALYYIGGIIKHARAINAFANASTNSYKRLVPGFEAPMCLLTQRAIARHQSHSYDGMVVVLSTIPDPTANPYLAFSAMLMAGLTVSE